MKISDLLKERLGGMGYHVNEILRVRRGHWGKAAGTWAWTATTNSGLTLGSEDTMGDCVKAPRLATHENVHEYMTIHVSAEAI